MSALAITLFENREDKNENYQPLVRAIFPEAEYDSALDENREFTAAVQDALCQLNESNPFGGLQWYFVEEYFLHGKSKEEIGKEIAENMDLLLKDLEISAIRFLRRPAQMKMLRTYIKK